MGRVGGGQTFVLGGWLGDVGLVVGFEVAIRFLFLSDNQLITFHGCFIFRKVEIWGCGEGRGGHTFVLGGRLGDLRFLICGFKRLARYLQT